MPPILPVKTRKMNHDLLILKQEDCFNNSKNLYTSNDGIVRNGHNLESNSPPPLPPKKKHSKISLLLYLIRVNLVKYANVRVFMRFF